MKLSTHSAVVGGAVLAVTALFASPAFAQASPTTSPGTVFVQTDNLTGNSVVAYDRGADGTLTQAATYPTGGLGGRLTGAVVDFTASQGALALDRTDQLLYAVNPGSNTLAVFGVRGDRLVRQQVVWSGGSFPVSVAFSGRVVYVLNARDGGSVQGFLRTGAGLIRIPAWRRPLGLDATLTPEFTHTPGQVAFSPDGTQLVVTTKANGSAIDVFAVDRLGGVVGDGVVNLDPSPVPFAVSFDAGGHLIVAEAGPNSVTSFDLHSDGSISPIATVGTGQAATCWIARAGASFYTSNAGSGSLTTVHDEGSGALSTVGNTATDPGTVDATVSGDLANLYVQTGKLGIVDEFSISAAGVLSPIGSVSVPGGAGAEGIVAT